MFALRTALKDIRRRLRDPSAFAIWLGIPLVLGLVINLAFGGLASGGRSPTAEIWVVDEDESALSGMLVTALTAGGDFGLPVVAREVELAEGRERIEDGDGSALLIIPSDFGGDVLNARPTRLSLVTNPTQYVLPQMVEESLQLIADAVFYIQQVFRAPIDRIASEADAGNEFLDDRAVAEISILINRTIVRMDSLLFPPVITLDIVRPDGSGPDADREVSFIEIFLPSMLFMALFFLALGVSEDIWVEKQQGTLRRALATPHSAAQFLGGKLLAATMLMAIIAVVTLAAARYLLGANFDNLVQAWIWTTLSGAFLLTLVYPLQLFATSQRSGGVMTSIVVMPLLLLGGSFFPFDMMPEGLERIGRLTPNGWALTGLNDILRDDVVPGRLAFGVLGMLLIGSLLFVIANRRMSGPFVRS